MKKLIAQIGSVAPQKFNAVVIGAFFVVLFLLLTALLFLVSVKEHYSIKRVVRSQQNNGGLYLSGLSHHPVHLYKLELFKTIKPEVVVIGSSRNLQFRGEDFLVPFTNMGLAVQSISQGHTVIDQILKIHIPKIIIIGVDFWWFQEATDLSRWVFPVESHLTFYDSMIPLKWFVKGQLTLTNIMGQLFDSRKKLSYGATASIWGDGYDKYGSSYQPSMLKNQRPRDWEPEDVLRTLKISENAHYKKPFSPKNFQSFEKIIGKLKNSGVEVITYIPPNYPEINRFMDQLIGGNLIKRTRELTWEANKIHFDFHYPEVLGSGECEFMDAWHGGEVTYLRILREFIKSGKTQLSNMVDLEKINQLISKNPGKVEIKRGSEKGTDIYLPGCG